MKFATEVWFMPSLAFQHVWKLPSPSTMGNGACLCCESSLQAFYLYSNVNSFRILSEGWLWLPELSSSYTQTLTHSHMPTTPIQNIANTHICVPPPGWGWTRCKNWNTDFEMLADGTPTSLATESSEQSFHQWY